MRAATVFKCFAVLIFILALCCGITIGLGIYTNGFESARMRYAVADGTVVKKNGTVKLAHEDVYFRLTGSGFKAADWGEYSVTVTANPTADITYSVGGEAYSLDAADLTSSFGIIKQRNGFTIKKDDYSLTTLIKKLYGSGAEITGYTEGVAPYKLTVSSGNGKTVEFYLDGGIKLDGFDITLDPSEIIFGRQ